MSAAEPARPGPDRTNRSRAGSVLPFPTAANRPPRRTKRREMTAVPDQPLTPQQVLASSIETAFARRGRSLTDDDTATDYLITLQTVRLMLEGARIRGVLEDGTHRELDALLAGMEDAPELLT